MNQRLRNLIERHWHLANQRDWSAFAELLSPDLLYEVPQTREYIEGGLGYLDLFRTWPGDWRAEIKQLVAEESRAVCIIDFIAGHDVMTGISIFEAVDGKLVKVTDYWPEPYEPPPRASAHMKRREAPLTLRLLTEDDLPLLHDWLNRPHIVEWWGGEAERPTLADVLADYRPSELARHAVTPYIALLGDEPVGYAQSYVALGSGDGWWADETDPGVRGIDQSLADPARLGRGLGTRLVKALVERLFTDPAVTKIQTDPAPENHRAIRCYEKAGFVRQALIQTPDGPAVYMVLTREDFQRSRGAI